MWSVERLLAGQRPMGRLRPLDTQRLLPFRTRLQGTTTPAEIPARYLEALRDFPGLMMPPTDDALAASSWHLFVVQHAVRDELARRLSEQGIETLVTIRAPSPAAAPTPGCTWARAACRSPSNWREWCSACPSGHHDEAQVGHVIDAVPLACSAGA
jgi:hypothetical protein